MLCRNWLHDSRFPFGRGGDGGTNRYLSAARAHPRSLARIADDSGCTVRRADATKGLLSHRQTRHRHVARPALIGLPGPTFRSFPQLSFRVRLDGRRPSIGILSGSRFPFRSAFSIEKLVDITRRWALSRMATSTFPPPPRFYRLYAPEQVDDDAGRREDDERGKRGAVRRPPEPPEPPEATEFEAFGLIYTLEDGLPPLRTDKVLFEVNDGRVDFKSELLKLNKEILYHYIDLIDVLATRPGDYVHALADLDAVFQNAHYLLNAMRHFQARATLQHALQTQIDDHRQAIEDLRITVQKHRSEVLRSLQRLSTSMSTSDGMEVDPNVHPHDPPATTEGS